MTVAALLVAGLALLFAIVLAAALVELHTEFQQVRNIAGIVDTSVVVELPPNRSSVPSDHGLPTRLDDETVLLLFVTPRCATCHSLARAMGGRVPRGLVPVVTATTVDMAHEWMQEMGLPRDAVIVDEDQRVADSVGVQSSPTGVFVRAGRIEKAATVPSLDTLKSMMKEQTHEAQQLAR